MLTSHNKMQIR